MSNYSVRERGIARQLEAMPKLRALVRDAYYGLSYVQQREAGFSHALADGVGIQSAAQWAGIEAHLGPSFFGYFDKTPFSMDGRYLLQHEIVAGQAHVVAYDSVAHRRVRLGSTPCWNWQQGAQATWLDGRTVGYNTLENNQLGMLAMNVESGARLFLPFPIQSLIPGGYLSLNYRRLARTTKDYGYAIKAENFSLEGEDGVWRVVNGEAQLVLSLAALKHCEGEHYVNHCAPSPDGSKFLVIHRWVIEGRTFSRLVLCDYHSHRVMMDEEKVSHFCWADAAHFLVWGRRNGRDGFYFINADTGEVRNFDVSEWGDGHPSFSKAGALLADSYPDKSRQQHLYIYDMMMGERRDIGRFLSPWPYRGPKRCDLHPRFGDERTICIDSAHSGVRRSYVITL